MREDDKSAAIITPQTAHPISDPEKCADLAALGESLRAKQATGYRVGTITEDDKYDDDPAWAMFG